MAVSYLTSLLFFDPHHDFALTNGFATRRLLRLHRFSHSRLEIRSPRPHSSLQRQYRNIHLLSIDYALRPRLRPRLPQSRSASLWIPWIFGPKDSHLRLATHSGILSSIQSTAPFGTASLRIHCSSTDVLIHPIASVVCFSPGHFRRRASRLVSYYALFECMAASKPTS